MNKRTRLAAWILVTLAMTAAGHAEDQKPKSLLRKMFTGPDLPVELTKDVDVFPMARLVTTKRPFTFPPFKVTDFRVDADRTEYVAVPGRVWGEHGAVASDRWYSFTMNESDQPEWKCVCEWWGTRESIQSAGETTEIDITLSGEISLRCDLEKPAGETVWSLQQNMTARQKGLGVALASDGRLFSESGEFKITPLMVIEGSKVVGDVAEGYVFKVGESAVAAVVFQSGIPRRIVVHRSVASADRSLLVAAAAALTFGGRLPGQDQQ